MSDHEVREEILQFGSGGRLLGMLALTDEASPTDSAVLPVFVFLSAGMLHRVGPSRLHVRLARRLAQKGFASLRVDLSGKGDSPSRAGSSNQESVAADFEEILEILEKRLGNVPLVLVGLCSGADNAIRLAITNTQVVGMVLLDPLCFPDNAFKMRSMILKYTNPARYILRLKRLVSGQLPSGSKKGEPADLMALRDLPTREQMQAAFESIRVRQGRVFSAFTQYALAYYNHSGQLGRVLGVKGYGDFCLERFWPESEHTYRNESHRSRLMNEIEVWAIESFMKARS